MLSDRVFNSTSKRIVSMREKKWGLLNLSTYWSFIPKEHTKNHHHNAVHSRKLNSYSWTYFSLFLTNSMYRLPQYKAIHERRKICLKVDCLHLSNPTSLCLIPRVCLRIYKPGAGFRSTTGVFFFNVFMWLLLDLVYCFSLTQTIEVV